MILVVAIILIASLLVAAAGGARLGVRVMTRSKPDADGAGRLLAGATGLLALLIGFTFAMSAERFETRRALVVAEANALSTTYLRDGLLPAPFAGRLQDLVSRYGEARLAFFGARRHSERLLKVARRTGELQDEVWAQTAEALKAPQAGPFATSVLVTTNEMFDLAATRYAAQVAPVPAAILWLLALTAVGTAVLLGYTLMLGGNRHRLANAALLVIVGAAITLIVDLDTPTIGAIVVPQQPMVDEIADMKAHEARRVLVTRPAPAAAAAPATPG
ncbi:MAG: hypothetical protein ABI376_05590 [Caulobacteraceae bacterium]